MRRATRGKSATVVAGVLAAAVVIHFVAVASPYPSFLRELAATRGGTVSDEHTGGGPPTSGIFLPPGLSELEPDICYELSPELARP